MKLLRILSFAVTIFLVVQILDARKDDEEKEERRERRRQRHGRRRARKGRFGQPGQVSEDVGPQEFGPEVDQPPSDQFQSDPNDQLADVQPNDQLTDVQPSGQSEQWSGQNDQSSGECSIGTTCASVEDCPFVTSVGNGIPCPLTTRTGRTRTGRTRTGRTRTGICCPDVPNPGTRTEEEFPSIITPVVFPQEPARIGSRFRPHLSKLPFITPVDIARAVKSAISFVKKIKNTEDILQSRNLFARESSRESSQSAFFGNDPSANELSKTGRLSNKITSELASSLNLNQSQFEEIASTLNQPLSVARSSFPNSVTGECPEEITCGIWSSYKYRTADGSCNNLEKTSWGKALTPFNRLLLPDYEDGFDSPKVTGRGSGERIPSSRLISFTISPSVNSREEESKRSPFFTYLLMQWGQFLAHDLTSTVTSRSDSGASLTCCGTEFDTDPTLLHPSCFPITVPSNDPFYSQFGGQTSTCMSFVRSAVAPKINCALGPREQMNQLSSFIDGGMIYGSSKPSSDALRSFVGGQLASSNIGGQEFLPMSTSSCGIPRTRNLKCFKAGDGRVNVQANLVAMHALFLREHNLIAKELARLNPRWSDEAIFQESRRMLIGILQHITYNEYLPVILGQKIMNVFNLKVEKNGGFSPNYDPSIDPGIINSFATAAYRMHTLIPKRISFKDANGTPRGRLDISETYLNPSTIYDDSSFGNLVNGMASDSCSNFDPAHTNQVTNHMFKPANGQFGVDLLALNIQRGRDHGLPSYNRWRQVCNLKTFDSFDAMSSSMKSGIVESLKSLYASPEDIDLYVGGISEEPLRGSLVGPTFACILGEQFRRIKHGDRFWYENGPNLVHSFTPAQLAAIKNVTLARIMCDAGPETLTMQPFSFLQPNDDWNARTDCNDDKIPKIDFSPWIGEPVIN